MTIHMADQRPTANVNLLVYYRKHWFYLADNDIDSKRTFKMIEDIFNLRAGEVPGQQSPVLTIPVR